LGDHKNSQKTLYANKPPQVAAEARITSVFFSFFLIANAAPNIIGNNIINA
jgi:hypothetical protein